eukprot:9478764-Pyramimonas_sp.AAC.1
MGDHSDSRVETSVTNGFALTSRSFYELGAGFAFAITNHNQELVLLTSNLVTKLLARQYEYPTVIQWRCMYMYVPR